MGEIFAKQRLYFQGNPLTFCLKERNDSSSGAGGRGAVGRKFSCHGLSGSATAAVGAGAAFPGRYQSFFTFGNDFNPFLGSRCTYFIPGSVPGEVGQGLERAGLVEGVLPVAGDGTGGSLRSVLENFQGWGTPSCCIHTATPAQPSKQLWGLLLA